MRRDIGWSTWILWIHLEYQKGSDNAAADTLSQVPVRHDTDTVWSLLKGAVTGTHWKGRALMSQPLQVEHDHLSEESQAHTLKLAPMHMWPTGQRCRVKMFCWPLAGKWMCTKKDVSLQRREMHCLEDAWANIQTQKRVRHCSHIRNSFTTKKGMLYVNTTPKGETGGLLAFVVPSGHQHAQLWMACTLEMLDTKVSKEC